MSEKAADIGLKFIIYYSKIKSNNVYLVRGYIRHLNMSENPISIRIQIKI
jgi:hypothetical protein